MDNYFSSKDILNKAIGTDAYFQIKSILFSPKAADVAEVRHGRWIVTDVVTCSECRHFTKSEFAGRWNYCPNCGALMKEDEHEAG